MKHDPPFFWGGGVVGGWGWRMDRFIVRPNLYVRGGHFCWTDVWLYVWFSLDLSLQEEISHAIQQ